MFGGYLDGDLGNMGESGGVATLAEFERRKPTIPEQPLEKRRKYRTIWISDIHLGTRGCNAGLLIDFLDSVDSETMYLVGDIIDGWRLKK
jgi:DNA polymerase II small subunit/DNA polymerase delta subunit B